MRRSSNYTTRTAVAGILCAGLISARLCSAGTTDALTGRLLDADGKPVACGFVMLKEHPRCWNWTDGKGEFRIPVEAWQLPATLLASFAGHDPAETPVKDGATTVAVRLKREDPEFTKLEVGCALTMSRTCGAIQGPAKARKLSDAEQQCLASWEAFMKQRGGDMIDRIVAGEVLKKDEQPYRFMLHAKLARTSGMPTFVQWSKPNPKNKREEYMVAKIRQECGTVLRKAVNQQPLGWEDVEPLRLFRAAQGAVAANFTQLHIAAVGQGQLRIGGKLPDICFADSLALLESDRYSNYEALGLTEFLRPESLAYYLAMCDTYTKRDGRLGLTPGEELKRRYYHDYERFLGLQDMLKSGRPVLLNWAWFEDATHTSNNICFAEYIKRAYRGLVDVYHVNEASPDWLDVYISERCFFGPNPAADTAKGLLGRAGEEDMTPMERTARMTKIESMRHLVIGPPVLQQPPGAPWHFVSNSCTIALLDRQGINMVPNNMAEGQKRVAWNAGWFGWTTPFEVSNVHYGATTERALRAALRNGGNFNPQQPLPLPDYPKAHLIRDTWFKVVSVDAKERLVIARRNKVPVNGPLTWIEDETYRFHLRPDARIQFRRAGTTSTPEANGLMALADIQPGDRFRADIAPGLKLEKTRDYRDKLGKGDGLRAFNIADYKDREVDTVRLHVGDDWITPHGNLRAHIPLYGTVTASEGGQLVVQVDLEHVKSLLGLRFWREHSAKGDATDLEDDIRGPRYHNVKSRLAILTRWAEGSDADRTYTFALDPAVRTCRNGEVDVAATVFAAGDYVWIMYELWWETQSKHREAILPETIMAAEPVKR